MAYYGDPSNEKPRRCQQLTGRLPVAICGELARWVRPGRNVDENAFSCDAHHDDEDVPLERLVLVRRCRLQIDVVLPGVGADGGTSLADTIAAVEGATQGIRGCLGVRLVGWAMVRAGALPLASGGRGVQGDAE